MNHPTQSPDQVAQTTAFIAALQRFVRAHGGVCYRHWTPETLADYFRFHLQHGTLAWCAGTTQTICGVAIAWQTASARLDAVCPSGRVVFDWTPTDPNGDSVWVADVVCTEPGAWLALARCLMARRPHWNELPAFTYRVSKARGDARPTIRRHQIPDQLKRLFQPSTINPQLSTL